MYLCQGGVGSQFTFSQVGTTGLWKSGFGFEETVGFQYLPNTQMHGGPSKFPGTG